MSIKVFHIGATYMNGSKVASKDAGYFAVQAHKPNVLSAIEIARDYVEDYVKHECSLFDLQESDDIRGEYAHVYPLDGGVGIPLSDAQAKNLPIINEDDLYDMEYEIHDFSDSDKEDIFYMLREDIANANCWWECYLEDWCQDMRTQYSLVINWKEIEFSLAYVQGDFACFNARVEDAMFFLDAIGYRFKSPSHRRLFAWLNHSGYVDIHAKKEDRYTEFYASVEAPEEVWIRHKDIVNELDEDIQNSVSNLGYDFGYVKLYRHIRLSYEEYTTDESLTEMCDEYGYKFTWDKDKIDNWCAC